jgi:hypothetical protein
MSVHTHTHTQTNKQKGKLPSELIFVYHEQTRSLFTTMSRLALGLQSLLFSGYQGFSLAVKQLGCQGVKLTTDLYLVPRWGMHGAYLHFHTLALCGVQLSAKNNFAMNKQNLMFSKELDHS